MSKQYYLILYIFVIEIFIKTMKRKSLVIISIILVGSMVIKAQEKGKDKVGGIRGGFQSAVMSVNGSKPDTANSLSSFYVGFFRDNRISKIFYFGTGLEYFQNGLSYSNSSKRILHTISVPLDLKVKLGPVFVLGGVAANFKVAERIKIDDTSIKPSDGDISAWFDVPLFLGAGVELSIFTIEARYHWGLIEVRDGLYNRYFQIGAGISF